MGLLPNAKLASQIAPSRRYMHDKREKDKTRKSGEPLQRKVLALGEMCNVFSLTMYWNIVHARMEMAMYVPGGQKIPDLDQVVSAPAPCGVFLPRLTSILDQEPARPAGSRNATGPGLSDVEASAEAVFQSQPCERYGARLGSPTAAIPEATQ